MLSFVNVQAVRHARRLLAAVSLAAMVGGCTTLPSNGPTSRQIVRDAEGPDNVMGYRIVNLDEQTVPQIGAQVAGDGPVRLASLAAEGDVDTIGPGDILSVEVFEVGVSLFSGGTTSLGTPVDTGNPLVTPSARRQALGSGVVVDRNGMITVPYVGSVRAAGLTPAQVQELIQRGLRGMSQSPQVLVSVQQNVANTVVVMGMVARPGRQPLTLAREHLLDAIANAGGIAINYSTGNSTGTGTGPQDMLVRFSRGARTVEQPLDAIQSGSADDLLLLPGDRIEVVRQPRTFIVFGATARVSQVPFESRVLSLAEALARIGGPSDNQADPRAIFIFRYARGATALVNGQQSAATATASAAPIPPPVAPALAGTVDVAPQEVPVIYRLNMMKASSYFLSQRFAMQDKDVIYVANSAANQPTKLASIINLLFSPVFTLRAATR
jgi:polysaccharide export outer membrane protein